MIQDAPVGETVVAAALSSPAARVILRACIERALPVREIAEETGLPMATTYRHVHELQEAGLLVVERSALTPEGKAYDLYRSRLRVAQMTLSADGVHVSWKVNEPVEDRLAHIWNRLGE